MKKHYFYYKETNTKTYIRSYFRTETPFKGKKIVRINLRTGIDQIFQVEPCSQRVWETAPDIMKRY